MIGYSTNQNVLKQALALNMFIGSAPDSNRGPLPLEPPLRPIFTDMEPRFKPATFICRMIDCYHGITTKV